MEREASIIFLRVKRKGRGYGQEPEMEGQGGEGTSMEMAQSGGDLQERQMFYLAHVTGPKRNR